jgi:serine/threonine protein kinase
LPRVIPDLLTAEDFPVQFGRYTLMGVLGEGGMARVYDAELRGPSGFTKPVAVKVIRAGIASRGERLRRSLIQEARVGGLLNHPNVVEVNDFGEVDGLPFIVMPLVRGVGLDQLLQAVRPLPPGIALKIGLHVCAGLDHAHNVQAGDEELVHRDLKPSNIMVSRHGVGRILDFGIAKATALSTDATDTGQTKGTPAYMSPEQVAGEALDRRSDIFALGALLYEMLVGETMFGAASMVATLQQIVGVETHVLTSGKLEKLEGVLEGASSVVHRCLRLDPDLRYRDATELEADLSTLLDGAPPVPPLRTWVREVIESHKLGAARLDATTSVPSDGRIPAVGQVQWKQAAAGGVAATRAQVRAMPAASHLPSDPAASFDAPPAPAEDPRGEPSEESVPTDPRLAPAARGEPPPLPSASSLPSAPSARAGAGLTPDAVQPHSEAELQDSFFGTRSVDPADAAQVSAAAASALDGAAAASDPSAAEPVAATRELPARAPRRMDHPPADAVGPTNRHPQVARPWPRTMVPVLVFALGLMIAVAGVATIASSLLDGQPAPSEIALADLSAKQHEERARDRVDAEERARGLADEDAAAVEEPAEEGEDEDAAEEPEEDAAPTRSAGPAAAKKKRTSKRSARRASTRAASAPVPTPTPTPTPVATPAPTPSAPSVGLKVGATITGRSGADAQVLFTVRPAGDLRGVPVVHTQKPGDAWSHFPLKQDRGRRYSASIRFTNVGGAELAWYVTANDGASSEGSAANPHVLRIR